MSSSLRELGGGLTPQHANGCTADGDLLDISMKDLVLGVNNIPPRWLKRRFMQSQFIQRLMPCSYDAATYVQDPPPFLMIHNSDATVVGSPSADGTQNEWRLKGTDNPAIPAGTFNNTLVGQYAWTNAIYFRDPVILTGLALRCWAPAAFNWLNDWTYHTDAPPGKTDGQSLDDLFLEISVDNPFSMEARNLNDIELHKLRFPVSSQMMSTALVAPDNLLSVAPNQTTNLPQLFINLDNLCIPLHRDTRARISLVIPQYENAAEDDIAGWVSSGGIMYKPWQSTSFTLTATVLEPLGAI